MVLAETAPESTTYSAGETVGLLAASFRFSRGGGEIQNRIFEFLTAKHGDRFSLETLREIAPAFTRVACRYVYESGVHPHISYPSDTNADEGDLEYDSDEDQSLIGTVRNEVADVVENLLDYLDREPSEKALFLSPEHLLSTFCDHCAIEAARIPYRFPDRKSCYDGRALRYRSNIVDYGF